MSVLGVFGLPTFFLSKVGHVAIDAVLSEDHRYQANITENPVEDGTVYSDNIVLFPVVVSLECRISDATAHFARINFPGRASGAYKELVTLQTKREKITIITGLNVFQNMFIEQLTIPRTGRDGNSIRFSIVAKEILVVGENSATNRDLIAADVQHTALPINSNGEVAKVVFQ